MRTFSLVGSSDDDASRATALASGVSADGSVNERLAGRYELLGLIGVGGMGSVYRARDFELDEVVALKMLRRELVSSDEMLARFRQEVKLARRVTHRNVARTFDIGEHRGEKFLTMEYVEGESLANEIAKRGALPVGESVFIASEICAGLAAAHASGVVHRDLKPDNVLLAGAGPARRVVITDFGIARAVEPAAASLATHGVVTGTPAYMAPEQVEGGPIDARVDVYALGEILYEMLTGELAWRGESMVQIAAARLHRPPPNPRDRRADLPDALADIVLRAMARRPEDRFASAQDFVESLSSLTLPQIASKPGTVPVPPSSAAIIVARPVVPPESTTKPSDKTLAVLLFKNAGPPDDAYLAEGLTEDLIDALSVVSGLKVRALGAVQALRDQSDARAVGEELGVQVVVEGSVRRAGDNLRVNARLISVADGFQIWAKRLESKVADFLSVGDALANAIGDALLLERKAEARQAPTDPAALELYLRARYELQVAFREGTQRAISLFSEALRRAPHDPLILSGFAMAQVREVSFGDNPESAETVARSVVEEAARIAPNAPEPHLAIAALELSIGESASAARSLARALSLGRPTADSYDLLAAMLGESGPLDAAVKTMELALALEPRLHHRRGELARMLALLGQTERARDLFESAPDEALLTPGYWLGRSRVLLWERDIEGAKALLATEGPRGIPYPVRALVEAIATLSVSPQAQAGIEGRIRRGGRARRRAAYFSLVKAEVMALIGDDQACLASIADADAALSFDTLWFEKCPIVDRVRSERVFVECAARTSERARAVRSALGYP